MNHEDLLRQTEEHLRLINETKQLEERIEALTNGPDVVHERRVLADLEVKQKHYPADLLLAKSEAESSRLYLEETKRTYEANVTENEDLRRRLMEKNNDMIKDCYKFAAETDAFIEMDLKLTEEREKLAQLKLELAEAKGVLAGKEFILKSLQNGKKGDN